MIALIGPFSTVMSLFSVQSILKNVTAQVLDDYLRQRAKQNGATVHNGLFMRMEQVGHSVACHAAPKACRVCSLPSALEAFLSSHSCTHFRV